ncbi:hypothetical protein SLA2020_246080 [Shorea laevis]
MKTTTEENGVVARKKRSCIIVGGVLLCLIPLFLTALILALTLFKAKEPRIQLLSAALDGVAPRISFPAIKIQLNITLDLQLLVQNRNRASFRHGTGKSLLLYQGKQVGEVDIYPGLIPAMGSTRLACRLTLQVDKIASNIAALIKDVLDGEVDMTTQTRIPGRVTFLGFIKKHAVARSECQIAIAFPAFKVKNQTCKTKTKL